MIPGRRYSVLAPVLKRDRFTGDYETVQALCTQPRWPKVRDAADFELPDGRLVLIPIQQVLSASMTIGSLFSGIDGLSLGLEWAGLGPVLWQVEIDGFCQRVLARHWKGVQRHYDIRSIASKWLPDVDIICGGFPCQDISSAGKGAGLAGSRSGLWRQFARIVRGKRPRWVIVENVNSGAKLWVDAVGQELVDLGYAPLPVPLSAADVGAPHLRRRIFIIARLATDPDSEQLRQQQGRRSGTEGGRAPQPLIDGAAQPLANANRARQPQPQGREPLQRRRAGHGGEESGALADTMRKRCEQGQGRARQECAGRPITRRSHEGWAVEPAVGRVAHGVPRRVDRLRALGNTVVPQDAEVIGHLIRLIEEDSN